MLVRELIEKLKTLPEGLVVILQKDGEGNGYSPLSDIDGENCAYIPETTWYGDVKYIKLTAKLEGDGYSEEDTVQEEDHQPCVVLYPIN